jgi:hypothetical protein
MSAHRRRTPPCVMWLVGVWIALVTPTAAQTRVPRPIDAVQGIVAAFQQHPVVIIGESHWLRQAGDFYVSLVRDKRLQGTVQDIVIEFASRSNQALLDRYISGAAVPRAEVSGVWRDTTKVAGWESPIYADWLAAIRAVNKQLAPGRRFRVIAGDTAIDWASIHSHSQWVALGNNNVSLADAVVEQVLQKGHRALVVLGANHVTTSGDRNGVPNTTTRIESAFPGSSYVVLLDYQGLLQPELQARLDSTKRTGPTLYSLSDTMLGRGLDKRGKRLAMQADALLYLAPPASLAIAPPPPGSLERSYLKEVDRRSMIAWSDLRARKFLGAAAR